VNKAQKRAALFPWWVILIFIACFLAQLFFQTQIVQFKTAYDHDRNILIARGLSETGIQSLLNRAFVGNPPLYYIIHAIPMHFFGFDYFTVKLLELLMFFGGAIFVYLITYKVFESRKAAVLAFILSGGFTWTSLYASAVRYYSVVFFFSAFVIYAYIEFLRKPSIATTTFTGSAFGLSLLAKESFAFLGAALVVHFLVFLKFTNNEKNTKINLLKLGLIAAGISILVYAPWLFYLYANGLPMPWTTHIVEVTGNIPWGTPSGKQPVYQVVSELFTGWPVMFSCVILFFVIKLKSFRKSVAHEPALWALFCAALLSILFVTLGLRVADLHVYFFAFTPLPILSAGLVFGKENLTGSGYIRGLLFAALILCAVIMSSVKVQELTMPAGSFTTEDSRKFLDGLTPADTIAMGDWYSLIDVFNKAYADYFPYAKPDPGFFLSVGVDYYIHLGPLMAEDVPVYLKRFTSFHVPPAWYAKSAVVYRVNKTLLASSLGLECAGRIRIEGPNGSTAKQARLRVEDANASQSIPYISGNDGIIDLFVFPQQKSSRILNVSVSAIGFRKYSGTLEVPSSCNETQIIRLSPVSSKFFHRFNETRY